jgi:UDP-N-acetylglucosamine acyltransferase
VSIHPTALIDPEAELATDVEVGPFVVIAGKATIATGCRILAHAQIIGDVTIGSGCLIGRGAILGEEPQSIGFKSSTPSGVRIGEGNTIRELVTVHRSITAEALTVIGDRNYIMAGVHLGHDVRAGDDNILANNCLIGGHVKIGNRTFLGGGSCFHQFIRLGDLCMVKGASGISQDVPPFTLAHAFNQVSGLNTVGLRRLGVSPEHRAELKRVFRHVCRSQMPLSEALKSAESMSWGTHSRQFLDFFRQPSAKGICFRR